MTKRDRQLHELIMALFQIELTLPEFCRGDQPDWWQETIAEARQFLEGAFDEEREPRPASIIHLMPPAKQ